MEFKERRLKGVYEITLNPLFDERGFFMRSFDVNMFNNFELDYTWKQENHSRSEKINIIRGLHIQLPPYTETKLVRCIRGAILDVFVDLRSDSNTFGQWDSIELTEINKKMVLIPRGFAHGFCTLMDDVEILYKVDNIYSKAHEVGILWNDEDLKINWPTNTPILSLKDSTNITLKEFIKTYNSIK